MQIRKRTSFLKLVEAWVTDVAVALPLKQERQALVFRKVMVLEPVLDVLTLILPEEAI